MGVGRAIPGEIAVPSKAFLIAMCASGLAISSPAHAGALSDAIGAPDALSISGSIRARVEAIDGQFRPTGPINDAMISLRTDLLAEYDAGPVRFGGEVQDARAYEHAANSTAGTTEVNALELVQAYARLELGDQSKGAKGSHGLLTAGRFTMDVGSRRLIARNRFRNTTNAFTGVQMDWTSAGGIRAQAFWTMPQIRRPDDALGIANNRVKWDLETTGVQFFGGDVTVPRVAGGSAEAYVFRLAERDGDNRATRNRRLWTVGGRLFAKPQPGRWDHDVEGAYQFGTARRTTGGADLTDLDVSAWLAHGEAGYTFAKGWKPRVSAVFDAASGDSGRAGHYGRFDTLFGARRSEFGPTALFGALTRANIVSPGVRVEATPSKRLDLMAMYRALWLEDRHDSFANTAVKDASGQSGLFAGHQAEARVRYWLVPGVLQSEVGGAVLFRQGVLVDAPNARPAGNTSYGYFDLTLNF